MPFKRVGIFIVFIVSALMQVACGGFGHLQRTGTPEEKLSKAIEYYNSEDYYKAGVLLEDVSPILKGKAGSEDALYYLAYNYFKQDQFMMSSYYFKDFYLTYPRSSRVEETMYMHVNALYLDSPEYNLDQTSTFECLKSMSNFLTRFPRTQYMEQCNLISDNLNSKLTRKAYEHSTMYHKVGNYKAAVVALSNFIKDFPSAIYLEEAYYLRFTSQYHLAKNSIEGKIQEDRFYLAVEFFQNFTDKFPTSKHTHVAEKDYDDVLKSLEVIKRK